MAKLIKKYEIEVWFRYISYGEQEKDFNIHTVEAYSIQDAVNKASDLYTSHKAIPYLFIHDKQQYKATNVSKQLLYHLTSPICY